MTRWRTDSRKDTSGKERPVFGPDTIETRMRIGFARRSRRIVQEELEAALGAEKSARVGTRGKGIATAHGRGR